MITPVSDQHVHQLLSTDTNVVYDVPRYQREYSWARTEWGELFNDLLTAEGDHFLGTIICINTAKDVTKETSLELADGQQRMTRLSLLMAALYSLLREYRDQLDDEEERMELLKLQRRLILKGASRPRLLPQVQGSNHDDYLNVLQQAGIDIKAPAVQYLGVRRVMKCSRDFRQRLVDLNEDVAGTCWDMVGRVERAVIVKLEVASHADAFVLFESLNNRGMPLTPIDLIKNKLLSVAKDSVGVDAAFESWSALLADLGDEYAAQERFFRQYYNAFKDSLPPVAKATVATRSNLIRIYETMMSDDVEAALDRLRFSGEHYRRIIGRRNQEEGHAELDEAFLALSRAQGAPSYILLLRLMATSTPEDVLVDVVRVLVAFFVRRNLTGVPQTYGLPRIFMDLGNDVEGVISNEIVDLVAQRLRAVSASNETFRERLHGPVYAENSDVTRFILTSLAEASMTKETAVDLWAYDDKNTHFVWTIEHILPQGEALPKEWLRDLGGTQEAAAVQRELVHTLGNLTISGYNSQLSNKGFSEKKDRRDSKGNAIGYRNGLSLNKDVVSEDRWGPDEIRRRTTRLVDLVVEKFAF